MYWQIIHYWKIKIQRILNNLDPKNYNYDKIIFDKNDIKFYINIIFYWLFYFYQ